MQLSKDERAVLVEQTEEFFFEAMRHGWASGEAKFVTKNFSGWKEKTWVFTHPNFVGFVLVDSFRTFADSRVSEGRKSIYYNNGQPIWYMNYGGWYDKEVMAFLKEALMIAYKANQFVGGRGPDDIYVSNFQGLLYNNRVQLRTFVNFSGIEFVTDSFGASRGEHFYFGGSTI